MAIDEGSRHELYTAPEEQLGAGPARTLMEYLPPVGWADVATKRDLEHFGEINKREHELIVVGLREDMRAMETRIEGALRSQMFKFFTFVTTVAGIALVIARAFS
jgi:hypothetical protein